MQVRAMWSDADVLILDQAEFCKSDHNARLSRLYELTTPFAPVICAPLVAFQIGLYSM